jgi:hypothetical protein
MRKTKPAQPKPYFQHDIKDVGKHRGRYVLNIDCWPIAWLTPSGDYFGAISDDRF